MNILFTAFILITTSNAFLFGKDNNKKRLNQNELFDKLFGKKVSSNGALNLTDFHDDILNALKERRLFNINGTNDKF